MQPTIYLLFDKWLQYCWSNWQYFLIKLCVHLITLLLLLGLCARGNSLPYQPRVDCFSFVHSIAGGQRMCIVRYFACLHLYFVVLKQLIFWFIYLCSVLLALSVTAPTLAMPTHSLLLETIKMKHRGTFVYQKNKINNKRDRSTESKGCCTPSSIAITSKSSIV